jgi:hypothetical protein
VKCLIIGIPESSRVTGFCDAALEMGWPKPLVRSWQTILSGSKIHDWDGLLRLESPGRNWSTERALLQQGWTSMAQEPPQLARIAPTTLAAMSEPVGRILAMRQWYLGWQLALEGVARRFPHAQFQISPTDVASLFDKQACQEKLQSCGVAMPPSFGIAESADGLIAMMETRRCQRVFLKACHGSSASAVVALEMSRHGVQAFSTVELVVQQGEDRIYNRRPGKWCRGWAEVRPLLEAVCQQRAQVQQWIPKMGWLGKRIDFRVVTIAGRARHTVVRMSETPLTNLQLFSVRGSLEAFAEQHPKALQAAHQAAEQVARSFPAALTLGIDVAVSPDGRAWVLEANAFGDHLPQCLLNGRNTYQWQIASLS